MNYETVIGLEVHVQIKTTSKMFTRVAAGYGQPENTLTNPVVLALPGALPVLNKAAIDAIIKTGLMLDCTIAHVTRWDRKNYFYPDSPKNYQITQFEQPVCLGGAVEIELPGASLGVMVQYKSIPLTRIHLEEDVGKLNHGLTDSLVDYNRAGTPLMEIVTDPAIKSAEEAFAFLTSLRTSLIYAGISDCDMEKGQMRCDANISIRPVGETKLGTKVELKNLNSISYVRDGILTEIKRQINVVTSGGTITQETRLYDGESGRSASMRSKEMAHDYRYFPDPDLMPVRIDETWKNRLRAELPEHPFVKQRRFMKEFKAPYSLTSVLIRDRTLSDYFEGALTEHIKNAQSSSSATVKPIVINVPPAGVHPSLLPPYQIPLPENIAETARLSGSIIINYFLKELNENETSLTDAIRKAPSKHIAELVELIQKDQVSSNQAKDIFSEMFKTGDSPAAIVDRKGLRQSTDTGQLEGWCDAAIAGDPRSVEQVKTGNPKAINALKGAVMKLSAGKANPKLVDEILKKRLGV